MNRSQDSRIKHAQHLEKLHLKQRKVEMLEALIQTHETMENPDRKYLRELRSRYRKAQIQLNNMLP